MVPPNFIGSKKYRDICDHPILSLHFFQFIEVIWSFQFDMIYLSPYILVFVPYILFWTKRHVSMHHSWSRRDLENRSDGLPFLDPSWDLLCPFWSFCWSPGGKRGKTGAVKPVKWGRVSTKKHTVNLFRVNAVYCIFFLLVKMRFLQFKVKGIKFGRLSCETIVQIRWLLPKIRTHWCLLNLLLSASQETMWCADLMLESFQTPTLWRNLVTSLVPFGGEKHGGTKQVPYDISQTLSGGDKARFFWSHGPRPRNGYCHSIIDPGFQSYDTSLTLTC